jgi:hypothetical protein
MSHMGSTNLSAEAEKQHTGLSRSHVEVTCLYVVADVASLDVRLRERGGGPLEEQDLQVGLTLFLHTMRVCVLPLYSQRALQ